MTSDHWQQAKDILAVRLDTIGDVLMTTPAIRALKESCPGRRLTLITSSAGAKVAPLVPEIDDFIVYDAPWVHLAAPRSDSRPEYEMANMLRQRRFDAAVIFTVYSQNPLPAAFLCYLAGVPLRLAHCRENPYQMLTHWVRDPEPDHLIRHEVQRQLDLVATVGSTSQDEHLSLAIPPGATEYVLNLLEEVGVDSHQPWLVIHPGVSAQSRRYPPENYAKVARHLVLEHGYQVLFTGVGAERELVGCIQREMAAPSVSLVDRLDLGQLAALLSLSPLLIANNTGPVHVAAAVGTAIVDLYALTNPQHTPWAVPNRVLFHDVSCKYCYRSVCPQGHHHCLRLIPPSAVVEAACDLLNPAGARRSPVASLRSSYAGEVPP